MRNLTNHKRTQFISLLKFVHLDEKIPILTYHWVDFVTSKGGELENNLKVGLNILVVDDPRLDDIVDCRVNFLIFLFNILIIEFLLIQLWRLESELGVLNDPFDISTQGNELLLIFLWEYFFVLVTGSLWGLGYRLRRFGRLDWGLHIDQIVLSHQNILCSYWYVQLFLIIPILARNRNLYARGFLNTRLFISARLSARIVLRVFIILTIFTFCYLTMRNSKDAVDGFVMVDDLEVLVNQDYSFLEVINELFPWLLLIKFLL